MFHCCSRAWTGLRTFQKSSLPYELCSFSSFLIIFIPFFSFFSTHSGRCLLLNLFPFEQICCSRKVSSTRKPVWRFLWTMSIVLITLWFRRLQGDFCSFYKTTPRFDSEGCLSYIILICSFLIHAHLTERTFLFRTGCQKEVLGNSA